MRFSSPLTLAFLAVSLSDALPAPQEAPTPASPSSSPLPTAPSADPAEASKQLSQLSQFAQAKTNETLSGNTSKKRGTCNLWNLAVRREWGTLSQKERKSYTDAVLCLQAKNAKTPSSLIPGAKSRFDDWVGTHINQTLNIHYTGTFLAWHRYFTW